MLSEKLDVEMKALASVRQATRCGYCEVQTMRMKS